MPDASPPSPLSSSTSEDQEQVTMWTFCVQQWLPVLLYKMMDSCNWNQEAVPKENLFPWRHFANGQWWFWLDSEQNGSCNLMLNNVFLSETDWNWNYWNANRHWKSSRSSSMDGSALNRQVLDVTQPNMKKACRLKAESHKSAKHVEKRHS